MGQLQGQISTVNQNMNSISTELSLLRRNLVNVPQKTKPQKPDTTRDLDNEQWNSTTSGFTVSKEQSTIVQTYTSLLGKLLIQREYQTANITGNDLRSAQGTCLKSQMTWYFAPSFLARAFEYKSLGARGFIQRVIRTYPVIPGDHPIWRMCRVGNLKGIQTLLSSGQISPFSVDDDGRTLLHVSQNNIFRGSWKN
ncbi:hypothetical protein N431DRAFT_524059 [Stipitochalara longipes BDJ]|nr:hypothetical protein N431DRAFT_524059 [Stipitochalara longipes BDJ]